MPDNRYGFLKKLPDEQRAVSSVQVSGCAGPPWCTTAMVPDAKDHCAAIMAANILMMLGMKPKNQVQLADEAYRAIGPGPVANGLGRAKEFMTQQGMDVRTRPCFTLRSLERALQEDRPVALLIIGPRWRTDWHWVAAFGVVSTEDSHYYFKIADGWHPETRLYPIHGASRRIFGGSFFLC